jgi:hypothetical protein
MDTALPGGAPGVFPRGSLGRPEIYRVQVKELHAKAGERPVANSLRKKAGALGREVRRGMIEFDHTSAHELRPATGPWDEP